MRKTFLVLTAFLSLYSCQKRQLIEDKDIDKIVIMDCSEKINITEIIDESKIEKIITIINSGKSEIVKFKCINKILIKYRDKTTRLVILNENHIKVEGKTYDVQGLQEQLEFLP